MNITHYKGRKIPIVLVPYCIKTDYDIFNSKSNDDGVIPLNSLTNYQSISSIVYPDTLFFYDMINTNAITNSVYYLNDIFYSFSELSNNRAIIENLKNSSNRERYNTYYKNAVDDFKSQFQDMNDKYSMIELFMLISDRLVFEWVDDTLFIIAMNPNKENIDELKLDGVLSKDIKKCPNFIHNAEKFWNVLQEHISYKNLITSNLVRYYIDACQYDSNITIAL